jgi:hypothetical protein
MLCFFFFFFKLLQSIKSNQSYQGGFDLYLYPQKKNTTFISFSLLFCFFYNRFIRVKSLIIRKRLGGTGLSADLELIS